MYYALSQCPTEKGQCQVRHYQPVCLYCMHRPPRQDNGRAAHYFMDWAMFTWPDARWNTLDPDWPVHDWGLEGITVQTVL